MFQKRLQRIESLIWKRRRWLPEKILWRPFIKKSPQSPVKSKQVIQEAYSGNEQHTSRHQWSCHGSSLTLRKRSADHPLPSVCPSAHQPSFSDPFSCSSSPLGNVSQLPGHFEPIPCCHLIWHGFSHPEGSQGDWLPTDSSPLCCN